METKHTPGEWSNTGLEIRHKNRSVILANVYNHLQINQSADEALANAKLIAAAPDLLEALQVMLLEAERVAMLVDSKYWTEEFRELWNKNTLIAELAIKKATL